MAGGERQVRRPVDTALVEVYTSTFRYAYFLAGDRVVAEDITQEALVRTLSRSRSGESIEHVGAYMRRCVTNEFLQVRRRATTEASHRHLFAGGVDGGDTYLVDGNDSVNRLLDGLAPRERAVIVCRYYLDLSEAQTGAAMRCKVGTVKSLTHRALTKLRSIATELNGEAHVFRTRR